MDGRAQARPEHEVAAVDRLGVGRAIGLHRPGGERHQRRVTLEVRCRAGGRGGEVDPPAPVEPVTGQAVGEDLVGPQSFSISAAMSAAAFFASSKSIEVFSS